MSDLAPLVERSAVILCCGTGGVGKTTTAAAIGVAAARQGRRVVVVTIDPAKRLADALGLGALGNEPQRVLSGDDGVGVELPGELWALMLDTKATFDDLVTRYAADAGQRERILNNPFYRNISSRLSGTQEYMAAEKLYALTVDARFDLVVVDTPPARNALDFLDAPDRLLRFLDHRVYRALMAPARTYLRAVGTATQLVLRPIAKVVGAEVIADAMAFFQSFDGMEAGFRARSKAVTRRLHDPTTAYVLVAAPRADAVAEAGWFADRLAAMGLSVAALVVNRAHPRFGASTAGEARARAAASRTAGRTALAVWWSTLAEQLEIADAEAVEVAALSARVAPAPTVPVPLRASDVHDLAALTDIAAVLVPPLS